MDEESVQRPGAEERPSGRTPAPPSYVAGRARGQDHSTARHDGTRDATQDAAAAGQPTETRSTVYGRVTRFGSGDDAHRASPPPGAWPPPTGPAHPGPAHGLAAPGPQNAPVDHPGPAAPVAPPWWGGSPPAAPPWLASPGAVPPGAPAASWGGQPPWGTAPPRPLWPREQYASWLRRVGGDLVDRAPAYVATALLLVAYVPLYVGLFRGDLTAQPTWWLFAVAVLLSLASTGWTVYNRWYVAGRTGQSLGKRASRTWLVSAVDGRPIGMLNAFLRDLLHVLDGLAYVGYLWPLWDDRRQTLADKVIDTVVVRTPVPPLSDAERGQRS